MVKLYDVWGAFLDKRMKICLHSTLWEPCGLRPASWDAEWSVSSQGCSGGKQTTSPPSLPSCFLSPLLFFFPEYIWLNSQTLNAYIIQLHHLTSNKKRTGCQFTEMGNCMAGFLRLTGPPEPSAHPLPSGQSPPSDQPHLSCQAMNNLPGE